jgi:glycosyltransferase involved in cell wall biosynthesis
VARARPRRIALVTPGFSADARDWCIPALLDLVRALAQDDDVTVFALRYPHHRRPYVLDGARVVPFGAAQARALGRVVLWLRAGLRLRRDVRAGRFDVVHALWAHEPGALAAWACRGTRTPLVVSLLGGELLALRDIGYGGGVGALNRRLVRAALRRARAVTIGSEALRAHAPPGVAAARWQRFSLGVSLERFHPAAPLGDAPRLDGRPCLLSVASLAPVKDHATLLAAFARLAADRPEARLHLVGEGSQAPLGALAARLGLAERVRFHGALRHERLPGLYRQADLHVVSSRFESQCLAALEAAACATPLAGTSVGVMPEIVDAPFLARPGDAHELALCLERRLAAGTARDEALAARVAREFGVERSVAALRALYDALSAGRFDQSRSPAACAAPQRPAAP